MTAFVVPLVLVQWPLQVEITSLMSSEGWRPKNKKKKKKKMQNLEEIHNFSFLKLFWIETEKANQ